MDIAITGSSGLIGTPLKSALRGQGHRAVAVVRRKPVAGADEIYWKPSEGEIDAASFEGIDAIIHLAGAGVADKRWTDARKKLILDSRVDGTSLLANTLVAMNRPPAFVSGSAMGLYGDRGDEMMTEDSPRGAGFLADVVEAWEHAASPAVEAGVRVAFPRIGIVLSRHGGALAKQLPLFKLGLGGKFGAGKFYQSWISIDDVVRALIFLATNDVRGPFNLTAPNPVTNAEFTKTLGKVLKRPTLIPIPTFGPKLLFGGDLVDEVLLGSIRVQPERLLAEGFKFIHPELHGALVDVLNKGREVAA